MLSREPPPLGRRGLRRSVLNLGHGAVDVRGPEGEQGSAESQYAFHEGVKRRREEGGNGTEHLDGVAADAVEGRFMRVDLRSGAERGQREQPSRSEKDK